MGGAGNGLPSRSVKTVPLWRDHFEIPEYESAYMAYPKEVRLKAFDYGVYELLPRLTTDDTFELDVGTNDDIYVEQFYAKETSPQNGVTFRWSTESSSVQVPAINSQTRTVTVWLNRGARPLSAAPAIANLYLDDQFVGAAEPTDDFEPFSFNIPVELTSQIINKENAAGLRIDSNTWSPLIELGSSDDRRL